MFEKDYNWVLPLVAFLMILGITVTNIPEDPTWYEDIEDYQISSIEVTELASWIIEGRNDFLVFSMGNDELIQNIPNLVKLTDLEQLRKLTQTKPNYKKWILLTGPGGLSNEMAALLTKDWKRRVIQVKGGGISWQEQISNSRVDWQKLSPAKIGRLKEIRPFFHHSKDPNTKQRLYIAPKTAPLPFLQAEEEEVVEEGC